MKPTVFDAALLRELMKAARSAPRKRSHHLLHADHDDPHQRLLIALEPDSYIRPHRHLEPPKDETFVVLRGAIALLCFDDEGELTLASTLGPAEGVPGADCPAGLWHTLVALESGSVMIESKAGPFAPIADDDFASWAPAEGAPEVEAYLGELKAALR